MVPATAAERRPWPTKPPKDGSWPEPPPEIIETWDGTSDGLMYTILFFASTANEGLVRVSEWRAVSTRCVGSLMKCLADIVPWLQDGEMILLVEI